MEPRGILKVGQTRPVEWLGARVEEREEWPTHDLSGWSSEWLKIWQVWKGGGGVRPGRKIKVQFQSCL